MVLPSHSVWKLDKNYNNVSVLRTVEEGFGSFVLILCELYITYMASQACSVLRTYCKTLFRFYFQLLNQIIIESTGIGRYDIAYNHHEDWSFKIFSFYQYFSSKSFIQYWIKFHNYFLQSTNVSLLQNYWEFRKKSW